MTDEQPNANGYDEGTFGELVCFIAPGLLCDEPPVWPPDLYAIAASLLARSGGYVKVAALRRGSPADEEVPEPVRLLMKRDVPDAVRGPAATWRDALDAGEFVNGEPPWAAAMVPPQVVAWWRELIVLLDLPILLEVGAQTEEYWHADRTHLHALLLLLVAVSDETCRGFGIRSHGRDEGELCLATRFAMVRLSESESLGWKVHPVKARVLPKQHTPQRGLTIRSLTHHLALCPNNAVRPTWRSLVGAPAAGESKRRSRLEFFNALVLPWPIAVETTSFQRARRHPTHHDHTPELAGRFDFFTYERKADPAFKTRLDAAIREARRHTDDLDALIFPELGLHPEEARIALGVARDEHLILIGGTWNTIPQTSVAEKPVPPGVAPTNLAVIDVDGFLTKRKEARGGIVRWQSKHHRWCLDRSQITGYGLGGVLPASLDHWELTDVGERQVHFQTLEGWFTFCVLICEDLARQDPVYEVIRAVGPNLVVALLMDGPQLMGRWAARYATVLADDPGCSVLSVTSLGMSRRSSAPPGSPDRSRVIGLWRDIESPIPRELELEAKSEAGLLSLVRKTLEEFTADGRGDDRHAHFPVFAGFRSLHLDVPGSKRKRKKRAAATESAQAASVEVVAPAGTRPPRVR